MKTHAITSALFVLLCHENTLAQSLSIVDTNFSNQAITASNRMYRISSLTLSGSEEEPIYIKSVAIDFIGKGTFTYHDLSDISVFIDGKICSQKKMVDKRENIFFCIFLLSVDETVVIEVFADISHEVEAGDFLRSSITVKGVKAFSGSEIILDAEDYKDEHYFPFSTFDAWDLGVSIFPNPIIGLVEIFSPGKKEATLFLFDLSGNEVLREELYSYWLLIRAKQSIKEKGIPEGMYIYKIIGKGIYMDGRVQIVDRW